MKRLAFILTALVLLVTTEISAQTKDTLNFAERRFRFAEGTIGFDLEYIPSSGEGLYLNDGSINAYQYPAQLTPRFIISGLHFWRNTDLYINVPFFNILNRKVNDTEFFYTTGPETGLKIYPWKVKENSLRPYFGVAWNIMRYNQKVGEQQGSTILRSHAPLKFGLTFNTVDKLFELGMSYDYQNQQRYPLSREQFGDFQLPPLSFHASFRWVWDSSIKDAPELFDGTIERQVKKLDELGKLSSFSFAIGFNSSLISRNKYNEENYPFLDNIKIGNSHLDLGIGYYHHKWDAHINLAFRNIPFDLNGFDFTQKYTRRSIGLEVYKFLFDYHGFVPYLGLVPSYETHTFKNVDRGDEILNETKNIFTTGLIFGWDIRQDKRQWYILRTNLRYYPIKLDISGVDYTFNQFEFNFIQFVYYPTRHKWIKKARKGLL